MWKVTKENLHEVKKEHIRNLKVRKRIPLKPLVPIYHLEISKVLTKELHSTSEVIISRKGLI